MAVIRFRDKNTIQEKYGLEAYKKLMREATYELCRIQGRDKVYYLRDARFAVTFDVEDSERAMEMATRLMKTIQKTWKIYGKEITVWAVGALLNMPEDINNINDVYSYLAYLEIMPSLHGGSMYEGGHLDVAYMKRYGEIERAIEEVTGEKVDLIASGRTDAGVHALAQVANFKIQNMSIPVEKIPYALNSKLKKSIRIQSAEEVDDKFHSRYTCKKKTYRYTINNSEHGTAIYRNMQYHYPNKLDAQKMNEGAKYLIGEHDFKSFKASGTSSKSSVRTIYNAEVTQTGNQITIELTGNGFLYNMVRIIAGTLVEVGEGKIKPSDVKRILEAQDRLQAGKTLPANGLMLINVEYEEN